MARYRRARVNDEVGRVVAEAIRSVKDPRVAGELITVTQCEVSGDLKYAKVYFSVLGAESEKIKEIKKGLYSAAGVVLSLTKTTRRKARIWRHSLAKRSADPAGRWCSIRRGTARRSAMRSGSRSRSTR